MIRASIIAAIAVLVCHYSSLDVLATETLSSINNSNEVAKIRHDIRQAVSAIRTAKDPSLMPDLEFYAYTLNKGDTFWKILYRTGLNVDTVMSVNNLASPYSIQEGDTIYLPNMRGVIHEMKNDTPASLEKKYGIRSDFIFKANRITHLSKRYLFIPCGEISSLERSLFLGTGFAAPLQHLRRTSGFGMRKDPLTGENSFHTGVDLGCSVNTPVYAARAGKVVFTGYKGDYGKLIIIEHPCGFYSYYGHLSSIKVKVGDIVTAEDVIALSGNTGRTTGPHLHFEIRKHSKPINPVIVLR